jgi:hypothetical protein
MDVIIAGVQELLSAGGEHVDFIERLFHISPDGGSGATEAAYILAIIAIAVVLALRRRIARLIRRRVDRPM